MKKIILFLGILSAITAGSAGCAPLWIATGAVAGYAVSRDSVIMDLEQPWETVWEAAQEEVKLKGLVKKEDAKRGRLDATVEEAHVVVTLKQMTSSIVRVAVRARKNLLPKVDVAQRLAVAIVQRADRLD